MTNTIAQSNVNNDNPAFPLEEIYFYLTEGCNLACRHCWLSPKHQDHQTTYPMLPLELFKKIITEAKPLGLAGVKLTGGEPLMHPRITDIISAVKEEGLGLSIETNGLLCTPQLAEAMATLKRPLISVSLDGQDAETHDWIRGIKGSFDAAVKGIQNLVNAGIKPQIILTVMKQNAGQLEGLVQLADNLGAESVKFNILQPTGRGEKMDTQGETLTLQELLKLGNDVSNTLAKSTGLKLHFDLPAAFRPMSKMFGESGDGCASCGILKILGVLADGRYALCGIGSHFQELVFGDASVDRLKDVWEGAGILRELREGIPSRFEGICGRCHLKRICSASCIAQNYYRSKSLWKPFWFCEEAHDRGLFPTTRITPLKPTI